MKNSIKVILTAFGGIQVVSIPLKLYKDSYNTTEIECLMPKTTNQKSLLKMYASGRDKLGGSVWTSQTYNLPYEKDIVYNQQVYERYTAMLPEEFCRGNGQIEVTFAQYILNEADSVERLLTSGTVNLYIDGVGNNNAGVAISPYDITASKVNELVKKVEIIEGSDASTIPIQTIENITARTVQEGLEELEEKKVEKVQAEAGKLLLSNGKGGIEVTEIGIQEYQSQRTYIDIENRKQDTRMDGMQEEITANTNERHQHRNKELLDSYTVANDALIESVDKMHEHGNKELLDGNTASFTTELKGNIASSITAVEMDANTGIFTFIKNNGEKIVVDTLLEKVIVNFHYDRDKQALILENVDGSIQEIAIGALLSPYTGSDGEEITVTVNRENEIEARIKAGAITTEKIADQTITVEKMALNSVTTGNLLNKAVTLRKLARDVTDKLDGIQTLQEQLVQMQEQIAILQSDTYKISILEKIFPVGAIYSTVDGKNPKEILGFGEWEAFAEGRALYGSGRHDNYNYIAGKTVESGLPNIEGMFVGMYVKNSNQPFGQFAPLGQYSVSGAFGISSYWNKVGLGNNSSPEEYGQGHFNAGKFNGIYGRRSVVQPEAQVANIWKRIG